MMRIILPFFWLSIFLSCNQSNGPDVSGIDVQLQIRRFDDDLFAIDTSQVATGFQLLLKKYPGFLPDFTENILGLDVDSVAEAGNMHGAAFKLFIHDYRPVKDSVDVVFKNFAAEQEAIVRGLKHVKYYFPKYRLPASVITFIGPMNAIFQSSFGVLGDVLTPEGLGIGLQLHLGKDFSFYQSQQGQELYPDYISRSFTPATIPVNSLKNIVDDIYGGQPGARSMIEQMVEKGKQLYLLQLFLPEIPKHLLIRYSEKQLEDAHKNEAVIWDFFLNNELLNSSEQNIIKNYVGESPKTQEFGETSPGNLGSFSGWQIVKKYMQKFPETPVEEMLKIEPRKIYTESKYKPRS